MGGETVNMDEYAVSEECIACDACCNDFPDVFKMNGDNTRAIAYAEAAAGTYNPWDIITDCPVDAISLIKGELPPEPEHLQKKGEEELEPIELEDTRPWPIRWEEVKDQPENEWERMKRYGLAYTIHETPNKIHFRFAMPETVPNHKFKFKWGLPEKMPDYEAEVKIEGGILKILAKLTDKRVHKLCDVATSFPDRFLREFDLGGDYTEFSKNYSTKAKILDIVVDKTAGQAEAA